MKKAVQHLTLCGSSKPRLDLVPEQLRATRASVSALRQPSGLEAPVTPTSSGSSGPTSGG
jgi:hypothetical protein